MVSKFSQKETYKDNPNKGYYTCSWRMIGTRSGQPVDSQLTSRAPRHLIVMRRLRLLSNVNKQVWDAFETSKARSGLCYDPSRIDS
jgi:hypothetical protein